MSLAEINMEQMRTTQGANCLSRINVTERGHSLGNSYLFALVSHYMYPHAYPEGNRGLSDSFPRFRNKVKPLFESWGMRFLDPNKDIADKDNIQYCVMSNRTTIVVAFRGSDAVESVDGYDDWIGTDLDSKQKRITQWGKIADGFERDLFGNLKKGHDGKPIPKYTFPGMHTGFTDAYWKVRKDINGRIAAHGGNAKQLFITGHSLGSALATLAAIDQGYASDLRNKYKAQGVYTYGGPRVGNGLFKKLYKSKTSRAGTAALNTHRYVNNNDAVPMYPFDDPAHDAVYVPIDLYGLGEPRNNVKYTHVGRTCNIKADGQIVRDDREFRTNPADPRTYAAFSPHHSKDYCHEIFYAHVARKSWEQDLPEPPRYPTDEDPLH